MSRVYYLLISYPIPYLNKASVYFPNLCCPLKKALYYIVMQCFVCVCVCEEREDREKGEGGERRERGEKGKKYHNGSVAAPAYNDTLCVT